ncbi:MAG: N-acetyltransferase [Anaerolineae bacterium]|jgi:amino-acid N-acetyltransferase
MGQEIEVATSIQGAAQDVSTDDTARMVIRKAVVGDVPAIAALVNAFASAQQMLPRSHHQLYQNIRDFLVATIDGTVVGCGALHIVWDNIGEVRSLAVSSDWQGRGIGRRIVQELLDEAVELGLPKAFALTYQQAFFERMGFSVVPRETLPHKIWGDCLDCPRFPNCDEIAMIIDLEPKERQDEG